MDLKSEGKAGVGMETLTWIHTHKTAALLKAAVASGAVLAGASDEVRLLLSNSQNVHQRIVINGCSSPLHAQAVAKCEEYALKIGLAFQVNQAHACFCGPDGIIPCGRHFAACARNLLFALLPSPTSPPSPPHAISCSCAVSGGRRHSGY